MNKEDAYGLPNLEGFLLIQYVRGVGATKPAIRSKPPEIFISISIPLSQKVETAH